MWDFIWLGIWNLGLFVLSICVLAGCRTRTESKFSLINWPQRTVGLVLGDECYNATAEFLPDFYWFGMSGECRVFGSETECLTQRPPTMNLARLILEDLSTLNNTDIPTAILDSCRAAVDKPIPHDTAAKLGDALFALLLLSVFINLLSLAVAALAGSPFGFPGFFTMGFDALVLFACLCLCIAMMNLEGGSYLNHVHATEYSDREMIGLGLWLLLAMFVARLISHPGLICTAIFIILPVVLVFLLFLVRTRGFWHVIRFVAGI